MCRCGPLCALTNSTVCQDVKENGFVIECSRLHNLTNKGYVPAVGDRCLWIASAPKQATASLTLLVAAALATRLWI